MGKRIICGCVVLGIVACLIGCQKSDNYELMKESKQQVLPIYEKKDAEVQGEKCALETLQDVYKSDYILEEWKIEKIGEPGGIFCNDEAVLISDKKTDCIFEVDYAGNILKEVGGTGSGEGEFISPSAITMCNEKIYVLDQGNNRIQVLDKELDYIEEIKLKNTQSTDPNYIPEVLSVNQESIYVTGVSLENPVVDKYTDGKLKEIGSNFIGSIYSCNNQIYLINSMVRYYDEANDSFGALTSCPEWLMTIKDNKLKKLCELPDGLNISSFLLTDRGIICVSCAGAAVYRLSENGKYEEKIAYEFLRCMGMKQKQRRKTIRFETQMLSDIALFATVMMGIVYVLSYEWRCASKDAGSLDVTFWMYWILIVGIYLLADRLVQWLFAQYVIKRVEKGND